MFTLSNFGAVADPYRGAFLAVGNFDGVHRGHASLIRRLRALADAAGAPAVALTFDPRPVEILRPEQAAAPLTWTARKIELLEQAGASEVGVFQTGRWLLNLSARQFFERVVLEQFAARGMVEGPTFGFGRDRGGDAKILASWCAEAGLVFEIVSPTESEGELISTSRIRRALSEGQVDAAARWLGRPYELCGRVVPGAGRGIDLGFPTANLEGVDTLVPAHGIYAGRARVVEAATAILYPAAIHIGPNATFGETLARVEAHLLGFEGSLLGRTLVLELIEFLRPTRRFDSVGELTAQITADVARARQVLRG